MKQNSKQYSNLSAARRAFASAAALGAYNENELATGKRDNNSACESQQLQSSSTSSSGFNSNCSSQKDSSPSSSSFNIKNSSVCYNNCGAEPTVENVARKSFETGANQQLKPNRMILPDPQLDCSRQKGAMIRGATAKLLNGNPTGQNGSVPKTTLPSSLQQVSKGPKIADPIPIPPPPTSAQTGPSGKANLILVSPTGLSPPLPKRQLPSQSQVCDPSLSRPWNPYVTPEIVLIKHMDEYGKCKVIMDGRAQPKSCSIAPPLPAAIPSHAKLAPPATQKYIMRYLMSNRKKLTDLNQMYPMDSASVMLTNGRPRCRSFFKWG